MDRGNPSEQSIAERIEVPYSISRLSIAEPIEVPYSIPPWSGIPCHRYTLLVLQDKLVSDQPAVYMKDVYTFGQSEKCDFVLKHPSISGQRYPQRFKKKRRHKCTYSSWSIQSMMTQGQNRNFKQNCPAGKYIALGIPLASISCFHAVIQFNSNGKAYLYDVGSAYGTFKNKQQVTAKVYEELRVGDAIQFGQISQLYIFQGPIHLIPPEKTREKVSTRLWDAEEDSEEDGEAEYQRSDDVPRFKGTSLFAMRYDGGVMTAAESRHVWSAFGNVKDDEAMKLHKIWQNVYASAAGNMYANALALEKAAERCVKDHPKSAKEVAHFVRDARNEAVGTSIFFVIGRTYNETVSGIYEVYPCTKIKLKEHPSEAAVVGDDEWWEYHVREVHVAYGGSGVSYMKESFETDIKPYLTPGLPYEESVQAAAVSDLLAKDMISNAISAARKNEFCSDGAIKLVQVSNQPKGSEEGVSFHVSHPINPKDPDSGYGAWVPGEFVPNTYTKEV